jgi:hypothetical protein
MRILGHQGWTDFMSQFGLYIHKYREHGSATVMVIDPRQIPFVQRLFLDTGLSVELAETTEVGSGTCVVCHQTGHPTSCPRVGGRCRYLKEDHQGLCAFDDFQKWSRFRESTDVSFVDAFYLYHGLPTSAMYENFTVSLPTEPPLSYPIPYYVYHTQPQFPLRLPKGYAVPLEQSSIDFFGSIPLIQGASEIHLLQSSYCMLIYLLQLKYGLFSDKCIYVHSYARSGEYKKMNRNPQLSNWTFL